MGCINSKTEDFSELEQSLLPRQHLDLSHIEIEEIINLSVELADSSEDDYEEEYYRNTREFSKLVAN